jgi:DMSO/TMAO reductase YedYZ molybdopterin-dependent catalytic subunit
MPSVSPVFPMDYLRGRAGEFASPDLRDFRVGDCDESRHLPSWSWRSSRSGGSWLRSLVTGEGIWSQSDRRWENPVMKLTRGFHGRGNRDPRLPPGQYDVGRDWPVLTAEATPTLSTATWTFSVGGLVEQPMKWTWEEIQALPDSTFNGDIHCVTTWSKLGVSFRGVSVDTLLAAARPVPSASYVLATSHTGYTTNLPLEDVTAGKAWVVWEYEGEPLAREHGGPARLLVPHLYFWKSAKWVSGLEVMDHDQPGFWEQNGYHDRGDPWLEERYQGD